MSTSESGHDLDALQLLGRGHRAVEHVFAAIHAHPIGARREELVSELIYQLRVHAAVEEEIFYPAIRTEVTDGDVLAYGGTQDHQCIKEALAHLERLDPNDHEAELVLLQLKSDLREHVDEEEGVLFPAVRAEMDRARLAEIGRAVAKAREDGPQPSSRHAQVGSSEQS